MVAGHRLVSFMSLGALAAAVLHGCKSDESRSATAPRPTYYEDVSSILEKNCLECHRSSGISGRPLDTYSLVAASADHVRHAVVDRNMPPWGLDDSGGCGTWSSPRSLSNADITTILTWIDHGLPEGDPRAPVSPEPKPAAETSPESKATLSFGEGYVPAPGDGVQRCFLVDPGLSADAFLTGLSLRRDVGLRQVMLFALDSEAAEAKAKELEAADATPGFSCAGGSVAGAHTLLGVTSVDPRARLPDGTGLKIPAGRKLVAQAQYDVLFTEKSSIRGVVDLELARAARPGRWVEVTASAVSLTLNVRDATAEAKQVLAQPFQVLGVYPKMRRLGTTMVLTVDRPAAKGRQCMMSQLHWNYSTLRQLRTYASPVAIEAGSLATLTCKYNTVGRSAPVVIGGETPDDEECSALLYSVAVEQ